MATGDYIATIDDDDYADRQWLLNLYRAIITYGADIVHGPVVWEFPAGTPDYIRVGFSGQPTEPDYRLDRKAHISHGKFSVQEKAYRAPSCAFRSTLWQDGKRRSCFLLAIEKAWLPDRFGVVRLWCLGQSRASVPGYSGC